MARTSRSSRAGVIFPVSRLHRLLKSRLVRRRVSATAPIYLAAVLEYLISEVLELAGNSARDNNRRRLTPRHIFLAIKCDVELDKLWSKVIIREGGAMPEITTYIPTKVPIATEDKSK